MTRPSKRELERALDSLDTVDSGSIGRTVTAEFVEYGESADPGEGVAESDVLELSEPMTLGEGPGAATVRVARGSPGGDRQ